MLAEGPMNSESDIYGRRTLDFVEKLQNLNDYNEICGHVVKEMEWFGFTCVSSFSMPGPGAELKDGIMLNNRPEEYTKRYFEKNYIVQDPAVTELRKNLNPYT